MSIHFTKSMLAGMAMLLCLGGEANAQKTKCLSEINCQVEGDYYYYGYNKDGLVDSSYVYVCYYDEEYYHLYKYDDRNNIICEEGYCILPNDDPNYNEFSKSFEIKYEFDENNRKITRKNYNLDAWSGTGEFLLGGVYVYEYDEKGLLKQRRLYWDEEQTNLFEKTNYTYNEKNQLVRESYLTVAFGDENEDMALDYYYDEKGRIIKVTTSTTNTANVLEESENRVYQYDENDNLLTRITYATDPNMPNDQHILVYNTDKLASDVAFPITYEDDMDFYTLSKNTVKQDSLYRRDVEGLEFDLFDVQDWVYKDLDTEAGIENVIDRSEVLGFSRDNDGNIILNGLDNSENVRVYDVNGKMMSNCSYNGRVNVGNLPHGMYVLMTRKGCMKFSK